MAGHLGFEMRLGLRSTYINHAQPKVRESKEIDLGKPKIKDKGKTNE